MTGSVYGKLTAMVHPLGNEGHFSQIALVAEGRGKRVFEAESKFKQLIFFDLPVTSFFIQHAWRLTVLRELIQVFFFFCYASLPRTTSLLI